MENVHDLAEKELAYLSSYQGFLAFLAFAQGVLYLTLGI